jgi:DNA-binding NarL/FixJ family response regulator
MLQARLVERRVHRRRATDTLQLAGGRLAGLQGKLSARESEVAALVARGRSNREIATELVISEDTVKKHVSHALAKLELHNRTELAIAAAQLFAIVDRLT